MRSLTRHAVSLALVLCGTASSLAAQTPAAPKKSPGAIISGKVTIKDKPVPGIVVGLRVSQAMTPYEPTYQSTTDQDGTYRISDVPPGSYSVFPVAPAFVTTNRVQTVVLTESESVDGIDFVLVRGGVITGKVTDADGRPVIEQNVGLITADQPTNPQAPVGTFSGVPTDDRGIYRIFGLRAGRYKVTAGQGADSYVMVGSSRPSYKQTFHPDVTDAAKATVVEVTEGSEASNVDIALGRAAQTFTASGRVINGESGQPIVGFGLQLIVNAERRPVMGPNTTPNRNGEFKLEGLAPGKYSIYLQPRQDSDIRSDAVTFDVLDHDVTDLLIKSSPGMSVAGAIVLENTDDKTVLARLLQLTVHGFVQSEAAPGNTSRSATINADGSFLLKGLEAGKLFLSLGAPRDRTLIKGFTVARTERDGVVQPNGLEIKNGDQASGVKVVVSYGNATIHGVVKVENGTLPTGARFFVQVTKAGERISNIRPPQVDARGHFIMEGIPAGSYDFTVMVGGLPPAPRTRPPSAKQQVNVVDGIVNNVTITLDLNQTPGPPQ